MATPEIEPGWLSALSAWIAGIGATIFGGWKYIDSKFDKVNGHIEDLYKSAEADRKFTRDLHDAAMRAIHETQREIMREIRK